MSHFSQVKTEIKDLSTLKKALDSLGLTYLEAEENQVLDVKGWESSTVEATLSINPGCSYGIAVSQQESGFILEADWWAIETYTGKTEETIVNEIQKKYAYETVLDKVKDQGYSIVTEEESSDQIKLVVRRWT